ncbi:MAG TPA: HlyD family efflux transporter periplasmic adaptor subunit [Steroidobacteraceae bacterium]|nr:HlyD family efflux transporter periplasmic adaptor subunit [Steroidobacteraceae bacterium]
MNTPATEIPTNNKRKRGLLILGAVVGVGSLVYGAYWLFSARFYESTDDAYVASDIVQITSEAPGTVLGVRVDDTQRVEQGQALIELDPADAKVRVAAAEADLARAVRQVRGLYAQADQLRAQVSARSIELKQAEDDYARRATLVADGAVSGEELAHTRDAITRVKSALEGARQQLDATTAQIEGTTVATHPEVLAASARYHDAALALRRTTIVSPITGVVAKRSVQLGQRIAPGAPLMAIVPLDDVWVDANFKEGQLRDVRVGQPVMVHADLYGSDAEYHGKVVGVSAGSGSAFALLPAQNASGNWIKVVQRLPVRIALDQDDVKKHPLRVGLSMSAEIDVHDTSGALVGGPLRASPNAVQKSVGDDPSIDERVADIIRLNSKSPVVAART